jgi:preprotein translocase subunit YajC
MNKVRLGDEIVLESNGIGKIKVVDNYDYILGQVIEIKENNNIVILLY